MEKAILIDGNNVFMTFAQGLNADPRARHAVTDITAIRKMIVNHLWPKMPRGRVVLAVDCGSWRRDYFPEYKVRRRRAKDKESSFPVAEFIEAYHAVVEELEAAKTSVAVVRAEGAEGDDVIATIAPLFQSVIIESADQDLLQITKWGGDVKQYNPREHKFITAEEKKYDIMDHIIRGDPDDDVPNILSPDDCFDKGIRQTVMTAKRYEECMALIGIPDPEALLDEDMLRRYFRNKLMVDLKEIPADVKSRILARWAECQDYTTQAFSAYAMSHGIMPR